MIQELEKKETLYQKMTQLLQQIQGQIALLRELIKKEGTPKEEKKVE